MTAQVWPFTEPPRIYMQTAAQVTDIDVPAPTLCWDTPGPLEIDKVHWCGLEEGHPPPHRCAITTCKRRWP